MEKVIPGLRSLGTVTLDHLSRVLLQNPFSREILHRQSEGQTLSIA